MNNHHRIGALALLLTFTLMIVTAPANAQGSVVQCGVPEDAIVETDPTNEFCDIYQRQFAHKESLNKLKQDLKQRQENFAKPRKQAYEQYRKDLEAMHNEQGE